MIILNAIAREFAYLDKGKEKSVRESQASATREGQPKEGAEDAKSEGKVER